jgi:Ras-specific guanine nucleotide-releasing factor 1
MFSSPHAEMMRKRNNIIFNLVESEREYVHQLEILVANYVRPFRMGMQKKNRFLNDKRTKICLYI